MVDNNCVIIRVDGCGVLVPGDKLAGQGYDHNHANGAVVVVSVLFTEQDEWLNRLIGVR